MMIRRLVGVATMMAMTVLAPACTDRRASDSTWIHLEVTRELWFPTRVEDWPPPDDLLLFVQVGDSLGAAPFCCDGRPPFVLREIVNPNMAILQYSGCLRPLEGEASAERTGPDTVLVSHTWRSFRTAMTDSGCGYAVRVIP